MIQCDKCKAIQKSMMRSDEFVSFMNWHFCTVCWVKVRDLVKEWISK